MAPRGERVVKSIVLALVITKNREFLPLVAGGRPAGPPYMCRLGSRSIFIHFFAGFPRFFGTYFDLKGATRNSKTKTKNDTEKKQNQKKKEDRQNRTQQTGLKKDQRKLKN